jgi:hypothetical protein
LLSVSLRFRAASMLKHNLICKKQLNLNYILVNNSVNVLIILVIVAQSYNNFRK